jgi:Flp pilus assembly protein TadG
MILSLRPLLGRLLRDEAGSPSIQFAMSIPALATLVFGTIQFGMAFTSYAGVRNAVEVGSRYATVYPYPTTAQIFDKVRTSGFGINTLSSSATSTVSGSCTTYTGDVVGSGGLQYTSQICSGTSSGATYVDVSLTYPIRMSLVFIATPTYNMTYSRRVYRQ